MLETSAEKLAKQRRGIVQRDSDTSLKAWLMAIFSILLLAIPLLIGVYLWPDGVVRKDMSVADAAMLGEFLSGIFASAACASGTLLLFLAIMLQVELLREQRQLTQLSIEEIRSSITMGSQQGEQLHDQAVIGTRAFIMQCAIQAAGLRSGLRVQAAGVLPGERASSSVLRAIEHQENGLAELIGVLMRSEALTEDDRLAINLLSKSH